MKWSATGKADISLDRPHQRRQQHGAQNYQQKLRFFFQSQIPHKPSNPTPTAPRPQRMTRSRYKTKLRPRSSLPNIQNPHAETELDSAITSRTAAVPQELPPRIDGATKKTRRERRAASGAAARGHATDLGRTSRGGGWRRKW
jgi:hypothetical protein